MLYLRIDGEISSFFSKKTVAMYLQGFLQKRKGFVCAQIVKVTRRVHTVIDLKTIVRNKYQTGEDERLRRVYLIPTCLASFNNI